MIGAGAMRSLSGRLTLYYAITFAVMLGLVFLLLLLSITSVINTDMNEELSEDVAEFTNLFEESGIAGVEREVGIETQGEEGKVSFLKIFDSAGNELISSDMSHWQGLEVTIDNVVAVSVDSEPILESLSIDAQEAETRVVYGAISDQYRLVIGESMDERDEILELFTRTFLAIFLIALPVIVLFVWMLTRRSVRGIRRVSDAATAISQGELSRRVNATGELSEVQLLADTFDGMADRNQSLIRNMREMTDNIAHDLRSPLSRIRILAESGINQNSDLESMKGVAESTIVECDRLTQMINTSLDVAEAEAGVARVRHEELEIHSVIEDVCELYQPLVEQHEITFDYELSGECSLMGDTTSIQRMFSNVLDNAIKFTPAGGRIAVTLNCAADTVSIAVADNGPGIDAEHHVNIFNRFFRVDQSRSHTGSGLGLSYARAVARAHGGDISVGSEPHHRTVFTISLPRQFQPSEIVTPRMVAV